MKTLALLPEFDSYSYQPAAQYARVQHEGPAGRYAATVPNTTARVPATWKLDRADMLVFCRFYEEHAADQVPFLITLITKRAELRSCIAFFDAESFSLSAVSGHSYTITCTLQVAEA